MDWFSAQSRIRTVLQPGTNLNTPNSTYRRVLSTNKPIQSNRYGYEDESGFVVSIGKSSKINIPWSMLKDCFAQLSNPKGYDGKYFRERYQMQAADHGCHVHVVGQIFVVAGIAYLDGDKYRLLEG